MADGLTIKVSKRGYFRGPRLDNPQMADIGRAMVEAQKARIAKAINASDQYAKPLSKKYLYIKAKFRRTNRPRRDWNMTGLLMNNFSLRKATNNVIRAAPTSRAAIAHGRQADKYEQMIGFAGSDVKVVYQATEKQYGDLAKKLWVPVG